MESVIATPTPGPWYVGTMNDGQFIINQPPRPVNGGDYINPNQKDVKVLATVHYLDGEPGRVPDANARILAAGPELLAALKEIVDQWYLPENKHGAIGRQTIQQARDAIAKAEESR
jgi:hypothetical protein